MDITKLPIELKIKNKCIYLLNIIDHFSKYGMYYIIANKETNSIYVKLKLSLECNGYP